MPEPLVVDTMRLDSAGATLRALSFPTLPPALTATGSDAVSAAINATMPIIESPMIDGLPAAQAALAKTASSIAAAAGMYADTDQALADSIPQDFQLTKRSEGGARTYLHASAAPATAARDSPPPDAAPDPRPSEQLPGTIGSLAPQLNQTMGTAGSFVQSIQSSVQGLADNARGSKDDSDPRHDAETDDSAEAAPSAAVPETVVASATPREMTTKESA